MRRKGENTEKLRGRRRKSIDRALKKHGTRDRHSDIQTWSQRQRESRRQIQKERDRRTVTETQRQGQSQRDNENKSRKWEGRKEAKANENTDGKEKWNEKGKTPRELVEYRLALSWKLLSVTKDEEKMHQRESQSWKMVSIRDKESWRLWRFGFVLTNEQRSSRFHPVESKIRLSFSRMHFKGLA